MFNFNLNNLFKNRSENGKSSQPDDVEDGKLSNDEDDNAAPSESTVIVEDEPAKKVMTIRYEWLTASWMPTI